MSFAFHVKVLDEFVLLHLTPLLAELLVGMANVCERQYVVNVATPLCTAQTPFPHIDQQLEDVSLQDDILQDILYINLFANPSLLDKLVQPESRHLSFFAN